MSHRDHLPPHLELVPWTQGSWRNPPAWSSQTPDGHLISEAVEGSDAWQKTSYGFARDTEHGLLHEFEVDTAVEVEYIAGMTKQFDQAGLIVRIDESHWIKAGTEFADGVLRLSTVVTDEFSDWSTAPVPDWVGKKVTIRASWASGAVSVRARIEAEPFELIRLAPWNPRSGAVVSAGPYLCAPSRSGFRAEFTKWQIGPRDKSLH